MIYLRADGRKAHITKDLPITTGSVGMKVDVSLSEDYDGLASVVTFKAGTVTADVAYVGELVEVPPQVMQRPNTALLIGVYAQSADGRTVIPTVWDSAGIIAPGTLPVDFPQPDPAPSWAAQVQLWAEDAHNTAERLAEEVDGWEAGENERIAAESARAAAETSRARAEATRYSNESTRVTNEASRVLAEQDRQRAEGERESAESSRVSAETARAGAEAARASAETGRSSAESQRASAEAARKTAESGRASAESSRRTAESGRVSAEQARVSAEQARSLAEQARDEAESAREDAESDRETEWATLRASAISATSSANTAAAAASATESAVEQAEQARVAAESSRTSAESARETAEQSRQGAEDARSAAEASRAQAESQRASSELQRASAEQSRASAETARATAEQARATAESGRVAAESSRVTAESERSQEWDDLTQDVQDAIDAATEAAESVSDDVDALYNGIDMLRFDIRTSELEGGVAQTENAAKAVPVDLMVDGASTQASYTGLNLWDEEWSQGQINHTTGENAANTATIRSVNHIPVVPSTEYCLTIPGSFGAPHYYDEDKQYIGYEILSGAVATFTTPANCYYVRFNTSITYGATYKHDICLNVSGSMDGTYEPYVGGKPSPNPDYPQNILSVDELALTLAGKNLFDYPTEPFTNTNAYRYNSNTFAGGYRSIPEGVTTITASMYIDNSDAADTSLLNTWAHKSDGTLVAIGGSTAVAAGSKARVSKTYNVSEYVDFGLGASLAPNATASQLMAELGSTATTYEPYVGVTAPIDLQGHELRSLPDGTQDQLNLTYDRPSKRAGWAWYKASIEAGTLKLTKDSGFSQFQQVGSTSHNRVRFAVANSMGAVSHSKCNSFVYNSSTYNYGAPGDYYISSGYAYFVVPDSITSLTDANAWLAENPITLVYTNASGSTTIPLEDIELPVIPTKNATIYVTGGSSQPTWHMDYQIDADAELVEVQERVDVLEVQNAQLFGNQLTGTLSDTIDTTDDAYAAPPMALSVEGASTQVTTTGKNLLDPVTRTLVLDEPIPAGTAMTISCETGATVTVKYYDAGGTQIDYWTTTQQVSAISRMARSFTLSQDAYKFSVVTTTGTSTKPQLELGPTATSYEPYTDGKASPSPDYQQPILSVDDLSLVLAGKNMLDAPRNEDITTYGMTWHFESDGTFHAVSGTASSTRTVVLATLDEVHWPAGDYYLTFDVSKTASGAETEGPGLSLVASDGTIRTIRENYSTKQAQPIEFTLAEGERPYTINFAQNSGTSYSPSTIYRPRVWPAASGDSGYEPYVGTTVPDLLPEGTSLRSGVNGILKSQLNLAYLRPSTRNGWAWYSRELTEYVREVDLGTLPWTSYGTAGSTTQKFQATLSDIPANWAQNVAYCTCYACVGATGISAAMGDNTICNRATSHVLLARDTRFVDSGDAAAFKAAVSGQKAIYRLETPVTTQLDPIELPTLPAPTATVWCDGGSAQPTYQMQYVQDTNLVIAELRAALADLATS